MRAAGRCRTCSAHKDRVTLIIAFWGDDIDSSGSPGLRPCMPFNAVPQGIAGRNVLTFPAVAHHSGKWTDRAQKGHLQTVAAWENINQADIHHTFSSMPLPDLRCFIRDADCFEQMY